MDPATTFVEPRLAPQNATISDVVAWWLTGVDMAGAFEEYTSCVNVHKNLTIYGGANPDIAGIGVLTSLTILSTGCTIGSTCVILLGYILDHPMSQGPRLKNALIRLMDAVKYPLINFLDSAMFLSLAFQVGWAIFTARMKALDDLDEETGTNEYSIDSRTKLLEDMGSSYGGFIYSMYLLQYISVITVCPALSLLSTPYLWHGVKRRGFRLMMATILTATSGYMNFRWLEVIFRMGQGEGHMWCFPVLLIQIVPPRPEIKTMYAAWFCCFILLFVTMIRQTKLLPRPLLRWYRTTGRSLVHSSGQSFDQKITHPLRKYFRFLFRSNRKSIKLMDLDDQQPGKVKRNDTLMSYDSDLEVQKLKRQKHDRRHRILRIIYLFVHGTVYVLVQVIPMYMLWRVYWLRSVISYVVSKFVTENEYRDQEVWDLDTWSFSQILAMTLWAPALLEAIYIFIAKEEYPEDPQYIQEKRQLKREAIERERMEREAMEEHDSDWDEIVIGLSDKRQSEI